MVLLSLWREIFKNQVLLKFVSRYKYAAYAIVILSPKKDYCLALNIQEYLAMRLQEL
jgi:ABC-type maltose transport system permease subunit